MVENRVCVFKWVPPGRELRFASLTGSGDGIRNYRFWPYGPVTAFA